MKKLILLSLFFVLILISSVFALSVGLVSPKENVYSNTDQVTFKCNIINDVKTVILYTDITGNWASVGSQCNQNNCTFIIDGFVDGSTYNWNCWALSENPPATAWAPTNYSFVFHLNNNPPVFNGTLEDKVWDKNTVLNNVWDLDNYFYDLDEDTLTYEAHGWQNIHITIDSNDVISLSPVIDFIGSEIVYFSASDGKGGVINSNNIILNVTGEPIPPQSTCGDGTCDSDENCGNCLIDCLSSPNSCQNSDPDCTNGIWIYSKKADAECDSDDDCDSIDCNLDDCTCVIETTSDDDDEEEEFDSSGDEQSETIEESGALVSARIDSRSPYSSIVDVGIEEEVRFSVAPKELDVDFEWYLDEEKLDETDKAYLFKTNKTGKYEVKIVVKSGTDEDFFVWTVNVIDSGGRLVWDDTIGLEDTEEKVISITGYFAKGFGNGKDLVIRKWKESSILLGIVVLVIIILIVKKFRKKDDILAEFGKEGLFSKIKRKMRGWKRQKKTYIQKKLHDEVEKHVEFHVDKPEDVSEK